jgi:hypothetical protein
MREVHTLRVIASESKRMSRDVRPAEIIQEHGRDDEHGGINCQCERCKAVPRRWHDAVTLPDDVLLLPSNEYAASYMEASRSPWSMERRAMHREVISAEEEVQRMIKVTEREGNLWRESKYGGSVEPANVIITELRTDGRGGVKRFEISVEEPHNLLKE